LLVFVMSVIYTLYWRCVYTQSISELHFYAIPVILISFFSFLVAHCFLSVYEASSAFRHVLAALEFTIYGG